MPGGSGGGGGVVQSVKKQQSPAAPYHPEQRRPPAASGMDAQWGGTPPQPPPQSPITGLPPTGFVPQRDAGGAPRWPAQPGVGSKVPQGDRYRESLAQFGQGLNDLIKWMRR